MMLTANVGTTDRLVRLIAGLAIGGAGILYSSWWGVIGLVLMTTAFLRWCPAYVPFKLSTSCQTGKSEDVGSKDQG